jgi:hypothetical protein
MRKKIEKIIMGLFIIFLFCYYLIEWTNERKALKSNGQTIGKIINYYVIFPQSHYLVYEYEVNNYKYKKSVSAQRIFKNCEKDKNCFGLKFLVIYEVDNPSNSFIDLSQPR